MIASSFRNSLTQDLLTRAQEHRFLSPTAAQRVLSLLDHGLHLEQGLLGTGLLTREQYRLIFQEATGSTWEPLVLRSDAAPEDHWMAIRHAREILRALERSADGIMHTVTSHTVHFYPSEWSMDQKRHHRVESFVESALLMRLARRARAFGYRVEVFPSQNGQILHLERINQDDHAREWMSSLQSFLDEPSGILLIRRPDASMEDWIQTHLPSAESTGAWREARQPISVSLSRPHAAEYIEHAALMEQPMVVIQYERPQEARLNWYDFAEQGIPVRIIQSEMSPAGRAWSSYPL